MKMVNITESGMIFGDYPEDSVFKIEHSGTHLSAGHNVSSVEFIYLNGTDLLFVEAKSSSPREATSVERYNEFLNEITNKFIHSFDMYVASKLHRYNEITGKIQSANDIELNYKFYLVINGHKLEWLLPLNEELKRKLKYHIGIWKTDVAVINDDIAKKLHLIHT